SIHPPTFTMNPPTSNVNPPTSTIHPPSSTINPPTSTINPLNLNMDEGGGFTPGLLKLEGLLNHKPPTLHPPPSTLHPPPPYFPSTALAGSQRLAFSAFRV
ncbi:hypothetical protein T484DRAFT_1632601, partial [Baffinella frigidus]